MRHVLRAARSIWWKGGDRCGSTPRRAQQPGAGETPPGWFTVGQDRRRGRIPRQHPDHAHIEGPRDLGSRVGAVPR
ncbi:MAG TPA: hypothetical protein VHN80_11455, partial [Kineosporiaceae bacterium]|nr:hypothetical protein [Kineosporiaceae bacterium]